MECKGIWENMLLACLYTSPTLDWKRDVHGSVLGSNQIKIQFSRVFKITNKLRLDMPELQRIVSHWCLIFKMLELINSNWRCVHLNAAAEKIGAADSIEKGAWCCFSHHDGVSNRNT